MKRISKFVVFDILAVILVFNFAYFSIISFMLFGHSASVAIRSGSVVTLPASVGMSLIWARFLVKENSFRGCCDDS